MIPASLARYSKLIAAIVGALTEAVALGVLPDPWAKWATIAIAAVTALSVYAVPNTPDPQE